MVYRTKRFFLLMVFAALLCLAGAAASYAHYAPAIDKTAAPPEGAAEQLVYDGEFSKALLRGVNVAEIRLTAQRQDAGTGGPLRFKAEAISKGILPRLFGFSFRELVETSVEPGTFTLLSNKRIDEQGNRKRTSEMVVDSEKRKVTWTERDPNNPARDPRIISSDLLGAVHDLASAVYYLRSLPLESGHAFELNICDSGRVYRVPVKVVERKQIKTVLGAVRTIRLEPQVFGEGRLIKGNGSMSIWFTDDARHIPVKARINNEYGTIDIKLKSVWSPLKPVEIQRVH